MLSPASAQSTHCGAEWHYVLALGKKLYVALIAPVPVVVFPYQLITIQYVDLDRDYNGGLVKRRRHPGQARSRSARCRDCAGPARERHVSALASGPADLRARG